MVAKLQKKKKKERLTPYGILYDAPLVGIMHWRGFKKEVLPGVFMHVDQA